MTRLLENWLEPTEFEATRIGFGRGLVKVAESNHGVMALSADLMESVGFGDFQRRFPERTIEVGVAEQNLVTVASGLAAMGVVPFAASYAAFSPGRNWEQIRTTICINNQPVKLVGSHAGLSVGADGATHQMLEDIALMRVLPNMVVLAPGDSREAESMAQAMADDSRPNYVRLSRDKSPIFTYSDQPFEIGRAFVLYEGSDVCLIGTGSLSYGLVLAADQLAKQGISAEVVHVPTIKPLDEATVLASASKCGLVVTAEEAQVAAGFGSAVVELLGRVQPMPVLRLGVDDHFGESGTTEQLFKRSGLDIDSLVYSIKQFMLR